MPNRQSLPEACRTAHVWWKVAANAALKSTDAKDSLGIARIARALRLALDPTPADGACPGALLGAVGQAIAECHFVDR